MQPAMTWTRHAPSEEQTLLEAAKAGDAGARERLLVSHAATLRYVCKGLLRTPEDVEDAVQETYLRALRGLERFRGEAQVRTWLVRIAVNVCAERRRTRSEIALEHLGEDEDRSTPSPERDAVLRALLDEALAILPPGRRVAFLLQVQGWSQREIGEAQGWSVARVKVELYRARLALGAWVERKFEEER